MSLHWINTLTLGILKIHTYIWRFRHSVYLLTLIRISNGQHLQYNLKYLDLTECKVRPVTLGTPGNGDECLLDLTSHCYDLEKLSLAKLNLNNPRWLENIVQNSHTLKVLDLGYCTGSFKTKIPGF